MTNDQRPPFVNSQMSKVFVNPAGPHQRASISGSLNAAKTCSGDAPISRAALIAFTHSATFDDLLDLAEGSPALLKMTRTATTARPVRSDLRERSRHLGLLSFVRHGLLWREMFGARKWPRDLQASDALGSEQAQLASPHLPSE